MERGIGWLEACEVAPLGFLMPVIHREKPWCAAMLVVRINKIDSDSSCHWGRREKVFPNAKPRREVVKVHCRGLEPWVEALALLPGDVASFWCKGV